MKWLLRSLFMMVVLTLTAACMQAQTCPTPAAQLISPTPGSTLVPNPITGSIDFAWCNASADYFVTVESVLGAHDIFFAFTGGAGGGAGQNFLNLGPACAAIGPSGCIPSLGETIFFTLQTVKNKQILGTFQYTFTAPSTAAVMTGPAPGSTLTGSSATFTWSAIAGVSQYYLQVGTTLGGSDIWGFTNGTSTTKTLGGLPTDGSTLFVRLWTLIDVNWQFNDYTYKAVSLGSAVMTAPAPGSTLTGSSATFTWSTGAGVSQYYLQVGTTLGGSDIWGFTNGTSTTMTLGGLPTNGSTVFVRLWSLIEGNWRFNDYTYTAVSFGNAVMTAPAPGSTLAGSSATFTWSTGVGVSQYYLQVGTTLGGSDIWGFTNGTSTTKTLGGLPTDGSTVFVRLWSLMGGVWQFNDYTYTAASFSKAVMTSPVPGSTLPGSVATFTWSTGAGATQYYLQVGTTPGGSDIWGFTNGTSTTKTLGGLPTNGSTVFVRLWSMIEGNWQFNDYTYTAF